jgi:tyrosine-protein phosphatase YwqE
MLIIKEAKTAGVSKIISTSHYISNQYEFDETSRRQFLELIKMGKII